MIAVCRRFVKEIRECREGRMGKINTNVSYFVQSFFKNACYDKDTPKGSGKKIKTGGKTPGDRRENI